MEVRGKDQRNGCKEEKGREFEKKVRKTKKKEKEIVFSVSLCSQQRPIGVEVCQIRNWIFLVAFLFLKVVPLGSRSSPGYLLFV
jgi:hypothetical protein